MKVQRGVPLTSALNGVGGNRHDTASLSQGKWPGTHYTEGWVGTMPSLESCWICCHHRDSIPVPASPQRVVIPTTLPRPTEGLHSTINTLNMQHFTYNSRKHIYSTRSQLNNCWILVVYLAIIHDKCSKCVATESMHAWTLLTMDCCTLLKAAVSRTVWQT